MSGVFCVGAKYAAAPELLMVGRFLIGLTAGAGCTYVPVYLTEIAPTKFRGAIATLHQLAITLGILFGNAFSLPALLGSEALWPFLVGFSAIPALLSLVLTPFCVESPRFLYIIKRDEAAALSALRRLRARQDVSEEMEEMKMEKAKRDAVNASGGDTYTFKDLFKDKMNHLPLIATIAMQVLQQWSGINAVMFYSSLIFRDAGVEPRDIPFAILGCGIVNFATTIIAIFVIEKAGRRKLILIPCLVIVFIYLLLTACLSVKDKMEGGIHDLRNKYEEDIANNCSITEFKAFLNNGTDASRSADFSHLTSYLKTFSAMSYIVIVSIIVYIIAFAIGLGPIPMYITAEMFRQAPRAAASSIAQAVNWTCNLILSLTFLYLHRALGPFTFLPFLVVVVGVAFFVFLRIPETKGKTFEEVVQLLESKKPVRECCLKKTKKPDKKNASITEERNVNADNASAKSGGDENPDDRRDSEKVHFQLPGASGSAIDSDAIGSSLRA